ncbi:MAG: hypothetical protein D6731_04980 [Planctomycetota bacterium]|nr:MAG: hypothetical protein D6731_04980 [Planctomycetota bacterium]
MGRDLAGVLDARPLWLQARRAFAKPAQRSGCLAMDLALGAPVLEAGARAPDGEAPRCQGLVLTVAADAAPRLARREGYPAGCWERLVAWARPRTLAEALLELAEASGDLLAYRRELAARAGAYPLEQVHYLPHPVRVAGEAPAVVFVAPAPRRTGVPEAESIKADYPRLRPLGLEEVFRCAPEVYPPFAPDRQARYVELCLRAAAHGVWVGDLVRGPLDAAHPTAALLRRWRARPTALEEERAALRQAVPALRGGGYAERFVPDLEEALGRSGLWQGTADGPGEDRFVGGSLGS